MGRGTGTGLGTGMSTVMGRFMGMVEVRVTHQTGRACWLFEVPHVGYMAGNHHEITNVRVTNM